MTIKKEDQATTTATAKKDPRTVITFTKAYGRYVRGDVAGFSTEKAKALIEDKKVAVAGHKLPDSSAE